MRNTKKEVKKERECTGRDKVLGVTFFYLLRVRKIKERTKRTSAEPKIYPTLTFLGIFT